ncbi:FAD-binding oxidoreductase [Pseudomonas sp. Marseille-QA0892]
MHERLLADIESIVGRAGLLTDPGEMAPYLSDWRNAYRGLAAVVVRPADVQQVSAVVSLCAEHGIAIVPQGGNTGLCGGSIPDEGGRQIVLSLTRMNQVLAVDAANDTITVQAGVLLQHVQEAADKAGRFFPLSLGAEGSCTIGGNLATNAGGTAVLRYGNMRELTLGIEAVLPDGRIWNGLRALRKDNTGYDLKHLFIGSEGTLGIITAAVLRLYPRPRSVSTAWVALPSSDAAISLIAQVRSHCGDRLTGFELMSRQAVTFVVTHIPGCKDPFEATHPWYALIELSDTLESARLPELFETSLAEGFESGLILDAVIATNEAQVAGLWALREGISEAQNHEGPSLKHDISIPVSSIPAFVVQAEKRLAAIMPGLRLVTYGHVGDGNLHYNISKPIDMEANEFKAKEAIITDAVYAITADFNGSISAEHGLGVAKKAAAKRYKDPLELAIMQSVKSALDPRGLMNPGKVL